MEEKVRSFALREDDAIWKRLLVFVLGVIAFHKVYVAMLWRLCIFSKFCKGVY